jgi:outer membrane phospholipase A
MAATAPPRAASIPTSSSRPSTSATITSVAPKVYAYLGPTRDNPDIGDYRGHMDLKLAYGKPDGVEVATMLRKGKLGGKYSAQTSHHRSRLLPGTAGYLMASYFLWLRRSLLTYNQKDHPQLRIGYALWR